MSIGNVNGVAPAASIQNDLRTGSGATSSASAPAARKATPQIDEVTQQPKPPRFPWLSRLAQQLETAANQKPSFPPAPPLGDHLDRTA